MQKIEPGFLRMLKNDQPAANKQKLYSCIVYSTDAEKIKATGVIVGSVLPKFITARATYEQILQLTKMEEVSYIEGADTLELHE